MVSVVRFAGRGHSAAWQAELPVESEASETQEVPAPRAGSVASET